MKRLSLAGQRFGLLFVVSLHKGLTNKKKATYWNCECDCGTTKPIRGGDLSSGNTKSCGCLVRRPKAKRLVGARFGRLLVVRRNGTTKNRKALWLCKCDCGNEITTSSNNLLCGDSQSCGCYNKEITSKLFTKNLVGRRFGYLIAIEYQGSGKDNRAIWKCQCDCGRLKTTLSKHLLTGKVCSCGDCQHRVNGKLVSVPQKELAKIIGGTLNYIADNGTRIDVALPKQKIAIEYDSWFWHSHRLDKDLKTTEALLKEGWRVLRIKSNAMIPQKGHMLCLMSSFDETGYSEIILPDWGEGKTAKTVGIIHA